MEGYDLDNFGAREAKTGNLRHRVEEMPYATGQAA